MVERKLVHLTAVTDGEKPQGRSVRRILLLIAVMNERLGKGSGSLRGRSEGCA
jgi:hypothetical protein